MLSAIVAIVVAVVVNRSMGEGDRSNPTTAPQASTVPDGPTTTAAATTSTVVAPQLVASDESGRRYTVTASPFTVQLSFTGLCWVEARRGDSDGEVLVADAFEAGATVGFTESAIWIRLGYPAAATVAVNGVPLPPVPDTDPFNIEITSGAPSG